MPKIFRLTLSGSYQGVEWSNVWHWKSSSTVAGQADNLASEFNTQWMNAIKGIMCDTCEIDQIHVVDVPDTGDYATISGLGIFGTFGNPDTELPPAYTLRITLNTAGSPIRHGFKRFTGVSEDAIDAGVPSAGILAVLPALLAKFDDNMTNGGFTFNPIIVRYAGTPSAIVLDTPVTAATFAKFGYQRTRET